MVEEEEEERAVAVEVEKEHFQCSDCDKKYSFSHTLKNQTWSCKKKKEVEINFARRPLSSNVFSVKRRWESCLIFSPTYPGETWNVELNYEQGEKFNLQRFNVYIESCSRSL